MAFKTAHNARDASDRYVQDQSGVFCMEMRMGTSSLFAVENLALARVLTTTNRAALHRFIG